MGHIKHTAVIVTSWDEKKLNKAYEVAKSTGCVVTNIADSAANGYHSFAVVPHGSKIGWPTAAEYDRARDIFVQWLNLQRYEDGSTSIEWVEVSFGSDDGKANIVSESNVAIESTYFTDAFAALKGDTWNGN